MASMKIIRDRRKHSEEDENAFEETLISFLTDDGPMLVRTIDHEAEGLYEGGETQKHPATTGIYEIDGKGGIVYTRYPVSQEESVIEIALLGFTNDDPVYAKKMELIRKLAKGNDVFPS
jgi:hypothetical protein|tara:strand:- start:352 stop:708 length:357 start_codon:yes stop_codon:yes gene_type:complete